MWPSLRVHVTCPHGRYWLRAVTMVSEYGGNVQERYTRVTRQWWWDTGKLNRRGVAGQVVCFREWGSNTHTPCQCVCVCVCVCVIHIVTASKQKRPLFKIVAVSKTWHFWFRAALGCATDFNNTYFSTKETTYQFFLVAGRGTQNIFCHLQS